LVWDLLFEDELSFETDEVDDCDTLQLPETSRVSECDVVDVTSFVCEPYVAVVDSETDIVPVTVADGDGVTSGEADAVSVPMDGENVVETS
jgi:hypothetical protein